MSRINITKVKISKSEIIATMEVKVQSMDEMASLDALCKKEISIVINEKIPPA